MKLLIAIAFALSLVIANAATTNYMDTLVVTNLYMPVTDIAGPVGNYTKAKAGTLELNQNVGATGPYIIFKSIDLNPINPSYTTSVFFSTGGANGYGPYFASDIGVQGNIYCLGTVYAATNILWQTNIVVVTNALYADTAGYAKTCTGVSYTNIYRALLTQTGTAAPVATVLENTFGAGNPGFTITWTRAGAGIYKLAMTDLFPANKTFVIVGNNSSAQNNKIVAYRYTDGAVYVVTTTLASGVFGFAESILNSTPIEVLVYP